MTHLTEWCREKGLASPVLDSFIAVAAAVDDMTFVTRNVPNMRNTGVRLLNSFEKR